MKIITIGSATQDVFIEYPAQTTCIEDASFIMLQEGKKVSISDLKYLTGGGASNSAASFKQLGFEVETFCNIGTDPHGDFILKEFASLEISSKLIQRTSAAQTGTSFILPTPSGDRAILIYRGANALLRLDELPESALDGVGQIYITSLSDDASQLLAQLTRLAKQKNIRVACNPGTSQLTSRVDTLEEALPNIDVLVLNCYEAGLMMESLLGAAIPIKNESGDTPPLLHNPLKKYFHEIHSRGPKIAAVTNGADGVYVSDGTKIYYHPSLKFEVVSTVGAGDAFGSVFVGYLAHGKSIEEAIQAGIINSASVLMHVGAKTGLLTQEEIEQQRKNLDPSLLRVFEV